MTIYQVSFYKIYPECTRTEDDVLTAFVQAMSFEDAKRKVEERYKREFERAEVFAIIIAQCVIII